MERCPDCKTDYPFGYLSPVVTGRESTAPVCGVCALKIVREHHGTPDYMFRAPTMRWRQKRGGNKQWHKKHNRRL